MTRETASMSLAGSPLGDTRHVCAFFHTEEEEYRVLLPFIKEGFDAGHKAVHVINPGQRDAHVARLEAVGLDAASLEAAGQLDVRSNVDTYLAHGHFDADRMVTVFEQLASRDASGPFPRSRIVCRMDWASAGRPFVDDVIEFESRVNDVWRRHDDVVICTYHLGQFGGDAVIDIMRTHPMVIIGGTLQRNPFFVPPETFLTEFRARRQHDPSRRAANV